MSEPMDERTARVVKHLEDVIQLARDNPVVVVEYFTLALKEEQVKKDQALDACQAAEIELGWMLRSYPERRGGAYEQAHKKLVDVLQANNRIDAKGQNSRP